MSLIPLLSTLMLVFLYFNPQKIINVSNPIFFLFAHASIALFSILLGLAIRKKVFFIRLLITCYTLFVPGILISAYILTLFREKQLLSNLFLFMFWINNVGFYLVFANILFRYFQVSMRVKNTFNIP
jgi:hypothetical protein